MTANDTEVPRSETRRPENERKVWAEKYPGGDLYIEVGHMEHAKELYLQSGEAEALREILEQLDGESDGSSETVRDSEDNSTEGRHE